MKLDELSIQGFKPWRDTGVMRLAPITAFFGTNSSGKTSLLQFLLMLKQTAESPDRQLALNLGGDEKALVELGTFNDIFHRAGDRHTMESLEWLIRWTLDRELQISDPEISSKTLFRARELEFAARLVRVEEKPPFVRCMRYKVGKCTFGLERKEEDQKKKEATSFLSMELTSNRNELVGDRGICPHLSGVTVFRTRLDSTIRIPALLQTLNLHLNN